MKRYRLPVAALLSCAFAVSSAAALDVSDFDDSVDACTDFYNYVNHKWLESSNIPDDRNSWGSDTTVVIRNEKVLLEAFAEAAGKPLPPAGSAERKVVQFYKSGMDRAAIDKAGLKPIEPLLALASEVDGPAALSRTLARLHAVGINAGFRFDVDVDRKDSSQYLADIAQGGLGLPERDYYFRDDEKTKAQRAAYLKHVARTLELAGAGADDAARSADVIMKLETDLAHASMTAVERRDDEKTYNKVEVAKLLADAPQFPWTDYFRAVGAGSLKKVNLSQPEFVRTFAKMAAERPPQEWKTYLRWHILRATADKLTAAFEDEHFAFYDAILRGTKAAPPRERRVLTILNGPYDNGPMGQAVGRIFVEKAFSPEAKTRALELVANIKAALADRIAHLDWMGEATRAKALEKLSRMNVKVGYPDQWRDYSDADVGPYVFVENWLRGNAFDHRRDMKRLGQPVDRGEWFMGPQILNAYYSSNLNEIVFPAGILQPPYFDAKADDAVNYGAIGTVIGHEITHGFDDRGRRYDANGNLNDWWTQDDAKRYVERAERIEKQYSGFHAFDDLTVNGKLTLGENIADQGGVTIAYLALEKALAKQNPGKIDGLTPEQRFFVSYAIAWRSKLRPEIERLYVQTDPHSPNRFRVQGPLQQIPYFAKAFSCEPAKTLLGESQRANIW